MLITTHASIDIDVHIDPQALTLKANGDHVGSQTMPAAAPPTAIMATIGESTARLTSINPPFIDTYYDHLIALVPSLLQNSLDQGHTIAAGLTHHIFWAATCTDAPETVAGTLANAGAQLMQIGFPTDGYQGAAHAVLRTAREVYPDDWDSAVSSAWVSYLAWVTHHMAQGAVSLGPQPANAAPTIAPVPRRVPTTLHDIFHYLHHGPFAGNDKALDSVVTRLALRTGADIRYPRLDQNQDVDVITLVIATLGRMGFTVGVAPTAALPEGATPEVPASATPGEAPRKARWWNRLRRQRQAETASVPGVIDLRNPPAVTFDHRAPHQVAGNDGSFDAFTSLTNDPVKPAVATPAVHAAQIPEAAQLTTLTEILAGLQHGVFAGNDWALDGVLTRVALRTGADLRSPRPDQVSDQATVTAVLNVLHRMGYGTVTDTGSSDSTSVGSARTTTATAPRWWSRQQGNTHTSA